MARGERKARGRGVDEDDQSRVFDIDGTLLSFKTHRIPASAQQVLDSFHEQGIACVIATGRPTYQMPDWLFDLGWDAYITLSGQHCFDAEGFTAAVRSIRTTLR